MKQILVYADSISWGIIPATRKRFSFQVRWPGVLETFLKSEGRKVRVIEDCLNGRTSVWDDHIKPGRNGLEGLAQRIEIFSPLSLVVVMLGSNDFQAKRATNSLQSAQGIASIVKAIRSAPIEPGMNVPSILVVAPPPPRKASGDIAQKFTGAEGRCDGLSSAYKKVTEQQECHFFDAATVTTTSNIDGIHLDADQHVMLGQAVAYQVRDLI